MERSEILATMGELKLYGMKAAFDEIITTGECLNFCVRGGLSFTR